jgi:hypothetical protein
MRHGFLVATVFLVLVPAAGTAVEPEKMMVELRSDLIVAGLPLAESEHRIYGLRLFGQMDRKGEGTGTLELDPNAPAYDEFGFPAAGGDRPPVKLECTWTLVKKKTYQLRESPRVAAPLVDVEWVLFEIKGPKVTSRLSLAMEDKAWGWGRLLVHDKDGKVRHVVIVRTPPPPPPCHPGCFPAGTPIRTPGGAVPVDRIRAGDSVTTVGPEGAVSAVKVVSVFCTRNRLVEVRTEAGNLVTTETQPLALAGGGLRAAGELKAGDRVIRWDGRQQLPVTVRSVAATGREERVFNLILGKPTIFVADGFLVRSKPPAPATPAGADGLAPEGSPVRTRE